MSYWLMKSEPDVFGIDDLAKSPRKTTRWDGVRNFQARNFMRDQMRRGDLAFFYHSNTEEPGIAGVVKIVKEGYPDHTAFDAADPHFDAQSDAAQPRWYMVDVQLQRKFRQIVTLATLREHENRALKGLALLKRGNRLSVSPVSAAHWQFILGLAS
ncbi:MAG TPA: EVE domain-containing protein [Gammaproteobacteria bacterium]|nr:EVE domain-containing protein [Gammaproteobacteria bacterium]